jgi:hypothetical protein
LHGRICFRQPTSLVRRSDPINAKSTPALVRLTAKWSGNQQMSGCPHGFEVTQVLELQPFDGLLTESRIWSAAPQQYELEDVELGWGFRDRWIIRIAVGHHRLSVLKTM